MKIESGRYYKTRDGRKRQASLDQEYGGMKLFTTEDEEGNKSAFIYSEDGLYRPFGREDAELPDDLVEPCPTLTPHQQRTADMVKVMQAYVDGEEIEVLGYVSQKWVECESPIWNWKDVDYRIAPATTPDTIDWSHVAPEFKWMARDDTGQCYFFTGKPKMGKSVWYDSDDEIAVESFSSYHRGTCDWKDSLVKRPE